MESKEEEIQTTQTAIDVQQRVVDSFERAFGISYIKIAHAAEVLARTLYTFGNQGDQATPWDLVIGDVREYYIDRALEELKK